MAISKKYSRRIVVDGIAYRWRVPPEVEYDQTGHDGLVIVNVWLEEGAGQTLRLLGSSHPMRNAAEPASVITPQRVAAGIRAALLAGWQPTGPNGTFRLELSLADKS
jgi:hypothetical protein